MIRLLKLLYYSIRYKSILLYIKDEWYNYNIYSTDDPCLKVFDDDKKYIEAELGNIHEYMGLQDGYKVYYKITSLRYRRAGDYLHSGDGYLCDLLLHKVVKIKNEKIPES